MGFCFQERKKKGKGKEKEKETIPHILEPIDHSRSESIDSFQNQYDEDIIMIDSEHDQSDKEESSIDTRKKWRRYDQFQDNDDVLIILSVESEQQSDESDDTEGSSDYLDDEDYEMLLDDKELFATPGFDLNYDLNTEGKLDINDLWILLLIFKFQERFRLPDVGINSLISLFSLVLKNIDPIRFIEFSSTAYMARKLLDIKKISKTFAVYTDCNKLYNSAKIIPSDGADANSGFKCIHVEFPNHPMQSYCKSCGS